MSEVCRWARNLDDESGIYETSCGEAFLISDGTPKENSFKFCCYCGKTLEEDHWRDDDEEEAIRNHGQEPRT